MQHLLLKQDSHIKMSTITKMDSFDPFLGLGGCIVLLMYNILYRFPTMLLSFAILSRLGGCVEFWGGCVEFGGVCVELWGVCVELFFSGI